jgi:single-strand DNA-binding protein
MASVNKVILIGNLGKDPEVRYTPNGDAVATFSIATTRAWKDKQSGQRSEETEWHRLVAWGRVGEIAGEYLKKGRPVYIEGRLKTRKWDDKEGKTHYTTEVIVESLQLLGSREEGDGGGQRQQQQRRPGTSESGEYEPEKDPQQQRAAPAAARQAQRSTGFDDMDDDIPF